MAVLIDTNIFFRAIFEPEKLGERAVEVLMDTSALCFLSPMVGIELAIKSGLGKLDLGPDFEPFSKCYEEQVEALSLQTLAILPSHMELLQTLPLHHRDPFDRIMISQSISENMTFLTSDAKLADYTSADVVFDKS
ncbi:MAG: type II toxin-antitoxin system VapC family toxin [Pseudomonadota bacterium]